MRSSGSIASRAAEGVIMGTICHGDNMCRRYNLMADLGERARRSEFDGDRLLLA